VVLFPVPWRGRPSRLTRRDLAGDEKTAERGGANPALVETTDPINQPAPFASLAPATAPDSFTPLDLRVIKLWRLTSLIGLGIPLGGSLIVGLIVALTALESVVWILLGWSLLAALCGWLIYWYPPRACQAWGYRIDAKVLETRSGIWFRVIKLLPLSRLQHVDLRRGPLERVHGLASLILHTAGTHEATLVIPGLDADEAARLRDRLVAAGGDDAV